MRARTSIYVVVDASTVSDKASFQKSMETLTASVTTSAGRILADSDTPISVNGTPPQHVSIIAFDSMTSAQAWENTAAFKAFSADLQKQGKASIYAVGGISDTVPNARQGGGASGIGNAGAIVDQRIKLPPMPAIKDICKGC